MDRLNHAHTFIPGEAGETIQGMGAGPGLPRLESQIQWAHGPGGRVRGWGVTCPSSLNSWPGESCVGRFKGHMIAVKLRNVPASIADYARRGSESIR